mgnify:CR=1 FL=1
MLRRFIKVLLFDIPLCSSIIALFVLLPCGCVLFNLILELLEKHAINFHALKPDLGFCHRFQGIGIKVFKSRYRDTATLSGSFR